MKTNLSTRNLIVYQTLQHLSENQKTCCASYKELVEKSGYSKNTIHKALDELVLHGMIIKHKVCHELNGNLPNVYEFV